jgi:hypothetical protein
MKDYSKCQVSGTDLVTGEFEKSPVVGNGYIRLRLFPGGAGIGVPFSEYGLCQNSPDNNPDKIVFCVDI